MQRTWLAVYASMFRPGGAESTGFKRDTNVPGLRRLSISTSHECLLAPVAWRLTGACRSKSGHRESPRHSSDVVCYVAYSSKTLTGFAQLGWKCH
jgi:hypothetical protein